LRREPLVQRLHRPVFRHVVVPSNLIEDIVNEECVLFLGAGASTEGQGTGYWREFLIDELVEKCSPPRKISKRLPDVAQYFCEKMDAGNKGKLRRIILKRIQRFMNTPEAFGRVTTCHLIIASIPQFRIVVTTNWDQFMERAMNVVPIVARPLGDKDMAYWDDRSRQVLKMHGCISDPDSMIVTSQDYDDYMKQIRKSFLWNKIRDLMATKTFLFLGYSLRDPTFIRMYSDIFERIGEFARPMFVVTPDTTNREIVRWRRSGVTTIEGLAYPFLENVRGALIEKGILFDEYLEIPRIETELEEAYNVDCRLTQETEVGIASSLYIDGLRHGLSGLVHELKHGTTGDHVRDELAETKNSLKRLRKSRMRFRDSEVSYWSGRLRSLEWFLSEGSIGLEKYFSARDLRPIKQDEFEYELESEQKS
jgi:hypothetical protein